MKHPFYQKTKKEQNRFIIKLVLSVLALNLICFYLAFISGLYIISILIFCISLSIIAPFVDTPSLKQQGKLIYHSLFFITEKAKNNVVTVHGGTLLDYYFVLGKYPNLKDKTTIILQQYVEGLLHFIETCETNGEKQLEVKGTSYIINTRTAKKLGFKVASADGFQKMILLYNFFNLTISNSLAKGKLRFPKLKNTKTYHSDIKTLIDKKSYIKNLNTRLKASLS